MSIELFLASLLFTAGAALTVYVLLSRRIGTGRNSAEADSGAIETRVARLITELNHVANTHVNAVEDRRDELKRVIELANDRVRRLNMLLADLEILDRRLRAVGRGEEEGAEERDREQAAPPAGEIVRAARPAAGRADRHDEIRRLAREGLGIEDIALRTKVPHNEVEMVLRRAERQRQ